MRTGRSGGLEQEAVDEPVARPPHAGRAVHELGGERPVAVCRDRCAESAGRKREVRVGAVPLDAHERVERDRARIAHVPRRSPGCTRAPLRHAARRGACPLGLHRAEPVAAVAVPTSTPASSPGGATVSRVGLPRAPSGACRGTSSRRRPDPHHAIELGRRPRPVELELAPVDLRRVGRLARLRRRCSEPARRGGRRAGRCRRRPAVRGARRAARPVADRRPRSREDAARCRGPPRAAMRHTPVSSSPARIARSTGAAPRQRGSSEKWRLTIGSASSTCGLMSWPKATTTPRSAPASSDVVDLGRDRQAELERRRLHRARHRRAAPCHGACRRRVTTSGDVVAGGDERPQRRDRQPRACRGRRGAREAWTCGTGGPASGRAGGSAQAAFEPCARGASAAPALRCSSSRRSSSSTPSRWSSSCWNSRASSSSASTTTSLPSRSKPRDVDLLRAHDLQREARHREAALVVDPLAARLARSPG